MKCFVFQNTNSRTIQRKKKNHLRLNVKIKILQRAILNEQCLFLTEENKIRNYTFFFQLSHCETNSSLEKFSLTNLAEDVLSSVATIIICR